MKVELNRGKMLKILLINPGSKFLIEEKVFPPLGLLSIGAYLRECGYEDVKVLDLCDCGGELGEIDADIVGVGSNTPQFPDAFQIIKDIKKINKKKDAVYVFGGPHISGRPSDVPDGDIAVVGEGELALLDICDRKRDGLPQEKVIRKEYVKSIDSFPYPDRDLIDIKGYRYFIDGHLATTIMTSRGCPYSCGFCANNAWGKTLRMRTPEKILGEVKLLINKYGYDSFMFFDDTMTVNKKRMLRICELLKPLCIKYRCFIRSDTVNREVLQAMKDSGCVEVGVGIESGSQRILDISTKSETVETQRKSVKMCHDLGLRVKGFIIIGLPGENRESIQETKELLDDINLDDVDFTVYTPYPGSIIYENRDQYDISFKDDYRKSWYKGRPGEYNSLVSTSALTAGDIVEIRDEMETIYKKKDKWGR